MTKAEIVTKLAETANIQKKQAEKVVASLVEMIKTFIVKGERIALPGLGSFFTTARKARTGRKPRTAQLSRSGQEGGQVLCCGGCQE